MSKLASGPNLRRDYDFGNIFQILTAIDTQVNGLSEGSLASRYSASSAAPTGSVQPYAQGDITWDIAPVEAGAGGSKYVRLGWVCVSGGTPGTWKEMRVLTGN